MNRSVAVSVGLAGIAVVVAAGRVITSVGEETAPPVRVDLALPAEGRAMQPVAMDASVPASMLEPDARMPGKAANHAPSGRIGRPDGGAADGSEPAALVTRTVAAGDTVSGLLAERAGLPSAEIKRVIEVLSEVMEPRNLQPGQTIAYATAPARGGGPRRLRRLSIRRDIDTRTVVDRRSDGRLEASTEQVAHQRMVNGVRFEIADNVYASASRAGVPKSVLTAVYRQLSNRIDFRRDLQAGDRIGIVFERFRHGANGPVHAGQLLAVTIDQGAQRVGVYRYTTPDGEVAYYDANGVSLATRLSRAPVRGGRLSSLFGKRDHPILNGARMHKGLDFAAERGSPVVAAGDGRVVRASRYGSFGNYVRIRHNASLQTAYAHLSRYSERLRVGDAVQRGEVIGFVGATGLATGPNLHYEVLRDGEQVDPRALDLPPLRELTGAALRGFRKRAQRLELAMQGADAPKIAKLDER